MPTPLPASLRDRFKQYIEEGLSARAAALRLRISPATSVRWAQRIPRGEKQVAVMGGLLVMASSRLTLTFFKNSSHRIPISPLSRMPWLTLTEKSCIILVSQ